jgi:hypothetical protein
MALLAVLSWVPAPALAQSVTVEEDAGIAGAAADDAALGRGVLLPGGTTDPAGSISLGTTAFALPYAGGAIARFSVHDRVELVGAAQWHLFPGFGTLDMEELGVRAQIYRGRGLAVAIDLFGGHRYRSPDSPKLDDKVVAAIAGGGVGASACLDGLRCAWVGDAHFLWAREIDSHTEYTDELGDARLAALSLGVSTGARVRWVAAATAYVRRYLSGIMSPKDLAVYGGVRRARARLSLDLGLLLVTSRPFAMPLLGVTYRSR